MWNERKTIEKRKNKTTQEKEWKKKTMKKPNNEFSCSWRVLSHFRFHLADDIHQVIKLQYSVFFSFSSFSVTQEMIKPNRNR